MATSRMPLYLRSPKRSSPHLDRPNNVARVFAGEINSALRAELFSTAFGERISAPDDSMYVTARRWLEPSTIQDDAHSYEDLIHRHVSPDAQDTNPVLILLGSEGVGKSTLL